MKIHVFSLRNLLNSQRKQYKNFKGRNGGFINTATFLLEPDPNYCP